MIACYDEWDIQVNRSYMERYYSMLLNCLPWINGKALDQYEAVKPVVKFSLLGPAATDYPGPIRCKIESIRSSSVE